MLKEGKDVDKDSSKEPKVETEVNINNIESVYKDIDIPRALEQ